MSSDRIQLICLDLGGVLIRICRDWRHACEVAGVPVPARVDDPQAKENLTRLVIDHESGRIDEHGFDAGCAELLGVPTSAISAVSSAWLRGAYPGVRDLIVGLTGRNDVQVACLSNTNARHVRMMASAGENFLGLDRLHLRFLSYEIGHMKPSPKIYEHVQSTTGLPAASILFFDDNADNIESAHAAGWRAERIDPAADPPNQVRRHLRRYLPNI